MKTIANDQNNLAQDNNNYDVIIIGGGPAGSTAGIYTARANLKTLIIDKGLTAGALGITSKIANYPGINGEIGGAELLQIMRDQAQSFGVRFISERVVGVDLLSETKSVFTNTDAFQARALIIATGSMGRVNRIPGEERLLGRGVSYCAICDAAFFKNQEVVVAGNSDEAVEEALYLTRFVSQVHFLSPAPEIKAPQHLVDELNNNPKVSILLGASIREIVGEDQVEGVRFAQRGKKEQVLPIKAAFIYLQGGQPITDFLLGQLEVTDTGCLIVNNEHQTAVKGVYAIGDVLCNHIKQAVIAAGEGAVAGIAVEKYLSGRTKMVVDWSK